MTTATTLILCTEEQNPTSQKFVGPNKTSLVVKHKFTPHLLFGYGEKALPFFTGRIEPQPVPVWPQPPCHQQELDWVAQPVDQRCCINGNLIT